MVDMCCNRDEDDSQKKGIESDINSDSGDDNEEGIITTETKMSEIILIDTLKKIKVKSDSLFMQRHQNPWEFYEETDKLGEGFYGVVHKVRLIKNPEVIRAMKIIHEDKILQGEGASLIDEIEILKKLDHPNIMKIVESFVYKNDYFIVSEYCDQGHLLSKLEKLGKMDEIVVKFLMDQVFNAVAYLHSENIMHGDIKLENVLLYKTSQRGARRFTAINKAFNTNKKITNDIKENYGKKDFSDESKTYLDDMMNYEIKLIDFGCSKYFIKKNKKKKKLKGIIGTSLYCSPEVVDNLYNEISDEWSCGVLMYILLSGIPPFYAETEEEIYEKIKKCEYSFNNPAFKKVSKNCKDLIRKLLEPNIKLRIKASEALKHPFFTEEFDPTSAMTENIDFSYLLTLLNPIKYTSKFHETVIAYICKNFMIPEEEINLRKLFRYIDEDENNKISKEEIKNCLDEINIEIPDDKFDEIFNSIDEDNTGSLEYQEFIRNACKINRILTKSNIKNVFYTISQGKDKINGEDIKEFVFHDQEINDKTLEEYFSSFGMKFDDTIGFNDFYYIIKNNLKLGEKKTKKKSKYHYEGPIINEENIEEDNDSSENNLNEDVSDDEKKNNIYNNSEKKKEN